MYVVKIKIYLYVVRTILDVRSYAVHCMPSNLRHRTTYDVVLGVLTVLVTLPLLISDHHVLYAVLYGIALYDILYSTYIKQRVLYAVAMYAEYIVPRTLYVVQCTWYVVHCICSTYKRVSPMDSVRQSIFMCQSNITKYLNEKKTGSLIDSN